MSAVTADNPPQQRTVRLTLRDPSALTVWPAGLSDQLARFSADPDGVTRSHADCDGISNLTVAIDGRTVPWAEVGELEVSGLEVKSEGTAAEMSPLVVQLAGNWSAVGRIGHGWSTGRLLIEGAVGDGLGEGMTGGEIRVDGPAGHGIGRGMSGGRIVISGDAGCHVGGPLPGRLKGMTGGEIFVRGSVGANLGERMRRGTIVVCGSTGVESGREMLAGTIVIGGQPGGPVGLGMKRGTMLLLEPHSEPPVRAGTFEFAVRYEPTFVRVLLHYLEQAGALDTLESCVSACLDRDSYDRYSGDLLEGGRGEILIRAPHE